MAWRQCLTAIQQIFIFHFSSTLYKLMEHTAIRVWIEVESSRIESKSNFFASRFGIEVELSSPVICVEWLKGNKTAYGTYCNPLPLHFTVGDLTSLSPILQATTTSRQCHIPDLFDQVMYITSHVGQLAQKSVHRSVLSFNGYKSILCWFYKREFSKVVLVFLCKKTKSWKFPTTMS